MRPAPAARNHAAYMDSHTGGTHVNDESVGFIGLGTMGMPMATNLLSRGYRLAVYDVNSAAMDTMAAKGAQPMANPREVGAACRFVLTSLPSSPHVEAVFGGPDGVIAGMQPGGTLVDMSTIDPTTTRRMADLAAARGLRLVDAPVSGAPPKAADGTLTIMVGGAPDVVEDCRPILSCLGENVIHVGPVGMGQTVKLVNNLIAAISMAAVSEAFNIGVLHGVDPKVLYEVISKSSGDCWTLRTRLPYAGVLPASPANDDFAPGFMVDLMHKDVGLALDAAKAVNAPSLLGAIAEQLYRAARARGDGRKDFSAVARVVQDLARPDA